MEAPPIDTLPWLLPEHLRPYLSLVILEVTDSDRSSDLFHRLVQVIKRNKEQAKSEIELVADGIDRFSAWVSESVFDDFEGFVWRQRRAPSWATESSPFTDVEHVLTLCMRQGSLIVVLADDAPCRAISRWVDRPPRPSVRKLRSGVLNACLLHEADAKNLWLTNVRSQSINRPDSKALSGSNLNSALDPIGDGSFVLGSARVDMPKTETRVALHGSVGTTPRDARIWGGRSLDFRHFLSMVNDTLTLVRSAISAGANIPNPYPLLASQVEGLAGVHGAFEFRHPPAADLPVTALDHNKRLQATHELERVTIHTEAVPGSADAVLAVGFDGTTAGKLRVCVREDGSRIKAVIGHEGPDTDESAVRNIRELLQQLGTFSLHYASGHALIGDAVYQQRQDTAAFNNWEFADFSGFRVDREKPKYQDWRQIHDAIGSAGDMSLFSWVASTYVDGWLVCDDGPGELADFLHITPGGHLSLIHVKAATSASPARRIAVAPYEVVVSQAVKNLMNLDLSCLMERLRASSITSPAAWSSGQRVKGRSDFLEALYCREVSDPCEIVVIQPHVHAARYKALRALPLSTLNADAHRLRLLDNLLNSALVACIGSNAKFTVVGSA